jgi:Domain of unknown function (DUF1918)
MILAVEGTSRGPPYLVRWDDNGPQSTFLAGSDTVVEHHPAPPARAHEWGAGIMDSAALAGPTARLAASEDLGAMPDHRAQAGAVLAGAADPAFDRSDLASRVPAVVAIGLFTEVPPNGGGFLVVLVDSA